MSFILKEGVVPTNFDELDNALTDLFITADISPNMDMSCKFDMNGEVFTFSLSVKLTEYHTGEDIDTITLTKSYHKEYCKRVTIEEVKRDLITEFWAVVFTEVLKGFKLNIGGKGSVSRLSKVSQIK